RHAGETAGGRLPLGAVEGRRRRADRWLGEWCGHAGAKSGRGVAPAAIRQHPQLRHLGAFRFGAGDCGHGRRQHTPAGRYPMNLLTLVLLLPLAGFIAALAIPRSAPQASRNFGMAVALATFLASLGLLIWFDRGVAGEQFTVDL